MTKANIIDAVVQKTGLKKKDVEASINAMLAVMEEAFVQGEKVQFVGFGTFEVKARAERTGRNPHTGATMKIPASKNLTFSAGKSIKEAINK